MTETESKTDLAKDTVRKHPTIKKRDDGEYQINAGEPDEFQKLYNVKTDAVATGLVTSAINALGENGDRYFNFMVALPAEIEPQDAIEGMLCVQMGITQVGIVTLNRRMLHAGNYEVRESLERSLTRLSRTYLLQMEALRKHRAKAQQTVRVERVTVNEGGQAIVGDVSHRGAG